jgi:hypothetical protein
MFTVGSTVVVLAGDRRLYEVSILEWFSIGGAPLCERSLPLAGALSWWAMPLWSWRTCLHVTYTPPISTHPAQAHASTVSRQACCCVVRTCLALH